MGLLLRRGHNAFTLAPATRMKPRSSRRRLAEKPLLSTGSRYHLARGDRQANSARSHSCAWCADQKQSATYLKVGQPLHVRQSFLEWFPQVFPGFARLVTAAQE